jgi:adenine/guanine phosphoribosyltransferase-like PRPP-binding protein
LAVPVTRLYDRGITVTTSGKLLSHIHEPSIFLNPEAAKSMDIQPGDQLVFNGLQALAVLAETVPASVVLVPRSMGFPIAMPVAANLQKAPAPVRASGTR